MAVDYQADGALRDDTSAASGPSIDHAVLAYMIFGQDSSNGWTGAVMLTDSRTRPQHFAFATPIRPGPMQRLLYGETLDEYVKVDVIASKLIKELPKIPDVLFVESPELIAVRRMTTIPVAAIFSRPQGGEANSNLSVVQYSTGDNAKDHDQVGALSLALETSARLLDPFARMREALKESLKQLPKAAQTQ